MEKPNFKKMCLMYIQQLTNFPYIEKDFDALTDYQLLCKVVAYLNKIITNENKQNETITALYNAFVELKNYVDNYFDNLDVQDEIDNKLEEMVEDGTLEELLNNYTKAEFIFPKFWENTDFGDCNLIKYENKNILIDCYNTQAWSKVYQMLIDNGVTHIDYLIITHYHGDHFGNFYNLFNFNFINEDTKLFMPAETTTMGWNETITIVKNFCSENNLNYYVPYEGEIEEIGSNLKLTFTNCNGEILDKVYNSASIGRNQNNSSTVVLLENGYVKVSFLGDCEKEAYDRLEELDFFKGKVELHKMGHHGIESNGNLKVLSTLAPKFAVATGNIGDFQKCAYINSYESSVLHSLGALIYPCYMQTDYIKFISNGINMYCTQGVDYKMGDNTTSRGFTYYVDNSVDKDDYQDGTQTHPFKELMQAITSIPYFINTDINIRLADGTYGIPNNEESSTDLFANGIKIINNNKRNIIINGNSNDRTAVKINSTRIEESNVVFNNLTFMADNYIALNINNSNVILNNCLITSEEQTTNNGINVKYSTLCLKNCKIEKVKDGIYPVDSKLNTYHLEFNSITTNYIVNEFIDNNSRIENGTRYTTSTDALSDLKHYSKFNTPVLLYYNNTPDYDKIRINFETKFNKFPILLIKVDYANNGTDTFLLYDAIGKHKKITDIRGGANNATIRSSDLYIGTDYVELSSFVNFLISYADSSITSNYGTNPVSINSIIGLNYDELFDISTLNEKSE